MTRVLLVAYYFPPLGGAGIMRPLQLFQRLPPLGFDIHILTVKPVLYHVYEPELLTELDLSKIHRAGSYDPQRVLYRLGLRRVNASFQTANQQMREQFFPDSKKGWIGPATRLAERLHKQQPFDIVVSTSPPVSSHFVGKALAKELGIPWVADFRDFWEGKKLEDQFHSLPFIARARDALTAIASEAAAVVTVNKAIAGYLGSGEVIPNAYDDELASRWKVPSRGDKFVIGLLGTYSAIQPVEPLAKVIHEAVGKNTALRERIELLQVGSVDQGWLRSVFAKYNLEAMLRLHGPQPREKTVELMSEASLFYLALESTIADCVVPGRLFDLMASGRPILAYAASNGEVGDYLKHVPDSFCFTDDTIDEAAVHLSGVASKALDGELNITVCPEYATPHSWGSRIHTYADLLRRVAQQSAK